jgi:dihydrofolate reductase
MRKLIFDINVSLDGCCDHTKMTGSDETHDYFVRLMRDVDLLVFGRKTYELMVPFWPEVARNRSGGTEAMNDFAQEFASKNIVVFSRSLNRAEGENTRIVRSNLQNEILRLKQEPGRNILTGGVSIPSQLIQLGLIDEIHLIVHPIVVGEGRRLLAETSLKESVRLRLVDSTTFKSGCVALRYLKQ